jgi:hypothetical protein
MNIQEWQEKHPELFAEDNASFGCGEGWHKLVSSILGYVVNEQKPYLKLNVPMGSATYAQSDVPFYHFKVGQIKEKFGGLRFYYHTESVEHDWKKFDKAWYDKRLAEKQGFLRGYISAMEVVSEFTCEETGDRGIKTKTSWTRTLRPDLAEIANEKRT